MNDDQDVIISCEEQLLRAFSARDLSALDELLHDDVLMVLPNGRSVTKAIVLESYRSGTTAMNVTASDRIINLIGDTAIVSLEQHLTGHYGEQAIDARFRYIRVWQRFGGIWRVIAGAGVALT